MILRNTVSLVYLPTINYYKLLKYFDIFNRPSYIPKIKVSYKHKYNGRIELANNLPEMHHPNGKPVIVGHKRPTLRTCDYELFLNDMFPESDIGKLIKGVLVEFLSKQEHRIGWARKSACDDNELMSHPNETVASHMWGVAKLVMLLSELPQFQKELPNFNTLKALQMAMIHDVPEVKTGDITPVDGISQEEKHKSEREALDEILACFPIAVATSMHRIYDLYEIRQCAESKFVKDCDKLDFILTAFLLERQGFSGFSEFYSNSLKEGFFTKIAKDVANTLIQTRNELEEKNLLYKQYFPD